MKVLHRIQYGMYYILVLKNNEHNKLGTLVAVTEDCPLPYDLLTNSSNLSEEEQIEELKSEGARVVLPIYEDNTKQKVIAYYVYFFDPEVQAVDNLSEDEIVKVLSKEIKLYYFEKYLLVLKHKKRNIKEIKAATIQGLQKALNLFKVPFEFTADEQLAVLHKNRKCHTRKHCYAKCKYYKNKEGKYVLCKPMEQAKNKTNK